MLTDAFAVTLHKRLFGEVWNWAGSFRRTGKNIGIDPLHIGVELRTLMDDARYWTEHGTYAPVKSAVRLHHRLVVIHPFPNGNGRHARIMADAMLRRVFRVDPIDWAGGHDLQRMNDRRIAYIAAFKAADQGDFGPLLHFAGAEPVAIGAGSLRCRWILPPVPIGLNTRKRAALTRSACRTAASIFTSACCLASAT